MYDPNFPGGAQYVDRPTSFDIINAQHSAFEHGHAAVEAMSQGDTWRSLREQELENRARADEREMMIRMEQNRRDEINRLNQEAARRQEEMNRATANAFGLLPVVQPNGVQQIGAAEVHVPLDEVGNEFPRFGRMDRNGQREVRERFAEYFHQCVKRCPLNEVTEDQIKKWRRRFKKRRYDNIYSGDVPYMLSRINELENMLSQVAAECYRYGVSVSTKEAVAAINNLYKDSNFYKWEYLKYPRTGLKSKKFFDSAIRIVENRMHDMMDRLDQIHRLEFENWKRDPKNAVVLQEKNKAIAQRIMAAKAAAARQRMIMLDE